MRRDGGWYGSCGDDVVFLHQHHVVQAHAEVAATPAAHGIFLRQPQAGDGLACVEDLAARSVHRADVIAVVVAVPESVCRKFSAQRSPVRMARAGPVISQSTEFDAMTAPSAARQATRMEACSCLKVSSTHAAPQSTMVIARDQRGFSQAVGRNQRGSDVAIADVFRERAFDLCRDVGRQCAARSR